MSSTNITTAAKAKRDARIRRRILQLADAAKAINGVGGNTIFDVLVDGVDPLESDSELLALATDLSNAKLLEIVDKRRYAHEPRDIAHLVFRITADGTALLAESIPPNPLVADERITHPK